MTELSESLSQTMLRMRTNSQNCPLITLYTAYVYIVHALQSHTHCTHIITHIHTSLKSKLPLKNNSIALSVLEEACNLSIWRLKAGGSWGSETLFEKDKKKKM